MCLSLHVEKQLTQAGCKELRVEVGDELLGVGIKHAHPGDNVAGQTDADDLHDGLEDEQGKVGEVGMGAVGWRAMMLEGVHDGIGLLVGIGIHGQEVVGVRRQRPDAQRLYGVEQRHLVF